MYEKMLQRIRETSEVTEGEDKNLYKDTIRLLKQGRINKAQALVLAKAIFLRRARTLRLRAPTFQNN